MLARSISEMAWLMTSIASSHSACPGDFSLQQNVKSFNLAIQEKH